MCFILVCELTFWKTCLRKLPWTCTHNFSRNVMLEECYPQRHLLSPEDTIEFMLPVIGSSNNVDLLISFLNT